jgi:hypothetical protein
VSESRKPTAARRSPLTRHVVEIQCHTSLSSPLSGIPEIEENEKKSARTMTLEQANYLTGGLRMLVSEDGLARHGLSSEWTRGTYVSQFESPAHGRMVIVNLDDDGAFGFQLGEIDLLTDRRSRASVAAIEAAGPPAPEEKSSGGSAEPSGENAEPSGEDAGSSADADAPGT